MSAIANIPNWHRAVYAALFAVETVCAAIIAGVVVVPPEMAHIATYAGLLNVFLMAFLPRIQTETGLDAPPILSPQSDNGPLPPQG